MKKKILIVEDNQDQRQALQTHLELLGYDSILTVNGKEAVDMATSQVPDLIAMDIIIMPVTSKQLTSMIEKLLDQNSSLRTRSP